MRKHKFWRGVLFGAALAAALRPACADPTLPGWQNTFNDDFNGTTLNGDLTTNTWSNLPRWGQDNINNEAELYVPSAVTVAGGYLHLTATKLTTPINYKGVNYYYTSGEIQSQGTENGVVTATQPFSQLYGRFEIRSKAPPGTGFWPAFWLLPQDVTWPPEIDVYELPQCGPGYDPSGTTKNAHVGLIMPGTNNPSVGGWVTPPNNFDITAFHTYAVEWDANMIKWLIDGSVVYATTGPIVNGVSQGVPQKPMYMIANLAVGGGWTGPVGSTTVFPSELTIDYMRAYVSATAASFTWNKPAGGTWSDLTSNGWNNSAYPQTSVDTANFSQTLTANQTVTLNSSLTLVALNLADASGSYGWNISGSANTLTFDSDNSTIPTLTAGSGTHTVSAAIALPWQLAVAVTGAQLTLSGPISGVGSVTKSGAGILILGNSTTASTYTGGTILTLGTLKAASPSALGNSSGALTTSAGTILDLAGNSLGVGAATCAGVIDNTAAGTATLTAGNGNANATFSSAIQNTGGALALNLVGTGAFTLSAASTYTGGTTLNAGTLNIGDPAALGHGTLTINGGAFGQQLNANLTIATGVPEIWNASFTVPNNANIKTLNTGTGNNITLNNNITISMSGYLFLTVPGVISDNGNARSLSVNGGGYGQLNLSAANTYSGGTFNNGANLVISNTAALGTGTYTINGGQTSGTLGTNPQIWGGDFSNIAGQSLNLGTGSVTLSGNRTVSVGNGSLTVGGVIAGNYSLTLKNSQYSPSAYLNAANTFTGGLTLQNSTSTTGSFTLKIGKLGTTSNASALGPGLFTIAAPAAGDSIHIDNSSGAAGTLSTNNPQAWNGDFTFDGSNNLNLGTGPVTLGSSRTVTVNAKILTVGPIVDNANAYGLTKAGNGTLTLSAADTFSGTTSVTAGTLNLSHSLALQNSTLTSAGIVFDSSVSSHAFTFGGLSGSSNLAIADTASNPVALTVGNNNTPTTYYGILSGAGSLIKSGSAALTLSGANTYTGTTTISAGTLAVNANAALGAAASTVTINAATLDFTANFSTSRSITLGTGSPTIQVDSTTGTQILSTPLTGSNLTKTGPGTLNVQNLPSALTVSAGTLQLAPGSANNLLATLTTLSVTGLLDLTNHDLLVTHGSANLASYRNKITTSTTLPPNHGGPATVAIALVSGSDYKTATGTTTLNNDDLYGKFTYVGDANLDGLISPDDYLALDLGNLFALKGWTHGDFAQTGLSITPADYALIDNSYQHQSGKLADDEITLHTQWFGPAYTDAFNALNTPASVPEPATLALLASGTLALLGRKKSA